MRTFTNPVADADEIHEAARGLAYATRLIDDPCDVYAVLGGLSRGLAALSQSLHQLGNFHDSAQAGPRSVGGDPHSGRAASYQAAWELHRAAEMLHQAAVAVDRAHEIEATLTYISVRPSRPLARRAGPDAGLSL